MMEQAAEQYDVGVVIGRFQVSDLHEGHRELLDTVCKRHAKVIVLLGQAPLPNSFTNPLDFQSREWMIREHYPHLIILPLDDVHSDEQWSKQVDKLVRRQLGATSTAVLYGSRDSFIKYYSGSFPTVELLPNYAISGTTLRTEVGKSIRGSSDWRAGRIHASQDRFPTAYAAVDIAVFRGESILLGQKPGEDKWRLPGGFADPLMDGGFREDAARELFEETGLIAHPRNLQFVESFKINDWRYSSEPHCVKTALFMTTQSEGDAVAADDLQNVGWHKIITQEPLNLNYVMPEHRPLVDMAVRHFKKDR